MTRDLTKGTPWKVLIIYAIPLFIGNFFQQLYSMVDTVIVGNTLGLQALAAVGSTGSLMFLINGFMMGIESGFAVPVAQAFGAKDEALLKRYVAHIIIWSIVIDVIMTAVAVSLSYRLLELMNTPEDIIEDAYHYLIVIYAGMTFTMLYNSLAGLLRAVGDSRTPLYFLILSCTLNIGLDFLCISVFHMGVAGAAYATIAAQAISGFLCLIVIIKKFPILHVKKSDFKLDWGLTRKMFGIGIPMALQFSITSIGHVVLQSTVNSFGSTVVGAQAAAGKIQFFAELPYMTLGTAIATYTAQNVGAKDYKRVLEGIKSGFVITVISTVIVMFICIVPSGPLLKLFVSDLSDEALEIGKTYLRIQAYYILILGVLLLIRNALQGAGITIVPMIGGVVELVLRISVCLIAGHLTIPDDARYAVVCHASPAAWVGATLVLITRFIIFYIFCKKQIAAEPQEAVS